MTGDEIGFSEISDVYRNERRSKVLTKLPPHFQERAEEHLRKLRDEHCTAVQTPNNPTAMMIWDQVTKVEKRLKLVYEMRERKITLAALDKMVGAQHPENMTKRERTLYEHLVDTLVTFRKAAEDGIDKECPPVPAAKEAPRPEPQKAVPAPASTPEVKDLAVVHVLEDIPEFAGLDADYELKKDDMVTLPARFASILSARGLVRIVSG